MTRRVLGLLAVAVLAVAALTAVVLCLPLLLPALAVEQFRRRPPVPCRCEDCADIADEFATIADRNPDLAGYGRQLPDLYLIPSTEESR